MLAFWEALEESRQEELFALMRELDAESLKFFDKGREPSDAIEVGAFGFDIRLDGAVRLELVSALRTAESIDAAADKARVMVKLWVEKHNEKRPKDIHWKRWTESGQDKLEALIDRVRAIASNPATLPEFNDPDTLFVVDLSCWVYKFWHVGPNFAAQNFAKMIEKIISLRAPARLAIAEDNIWPTFRHELAAGSYKAGRHEKETMQERASKLEQLRLAAEVSEDAFGAHRFTKKGFEADDVIATLATMGAEEGLKVVIVATDKDLMQLVTKHVVMWDGKGAAIGPEEVRAKYGVAPAQMVDYLTMVGDTTDNVAGIKGIGDKQAVLILRYFKTLKAALKEAQQEGLECGANHPFFKGKPALWAKLFGSERFAAFARSLVELRKDVDLGIASLDDLKIGSP